MSVGIPRSVGMSAVLLALMASWLFAPHQVAQAADLTHFITRDGDRLMDGEKPFRFISLNVPNLLAIEDAFSFADPNPWRWPDAYEIEDALESVRQMGGRVVRTYTITVHRDGSDMGELVHVRAPGRFNEDGFRVLDKVLQVAHQKGIRVIIPLVDNWKWMGGIGEYAAFRDKPPEAFWNDRQIVDDFKQTIRHLVERKNHYTGVVYRDDPAILGWETGNELDAPPEWTRQIAAYIKQLDANHLVIDGASRAGISADSLSDPNVDVVTTHHYPGWSTDFVASIRAARVAAKDKKPYIVGEFGFVDAATVRRTLDVAVEDGICGALLWSLRFHSRDGGFYWHSEGLGGDLYKAYHWPGFDSGRAYGERDVLQLMRKRAFEIQGREPPPLDPPAPPELLPIRHVGRISWRGSAGASSYDVERADRPEGPWATIGSGVSDAAVQYRPLFNDESAVPGQTYYYRVDARNAAGSSPPSNVVGPVAVESRLLVDEGADLSRVWQVHGDVVVATGQARRVQEDVHRLAMPAGSSIVYGVGGPISSCRVYAFASVPGTRLELSVSPDGTRFEPVAADREAFSAGPGVYGYLEPVLYRFDLAGGGQTYVRLAVGRVPEAGSGRGAMSHNEAPPPPGLEVSRVEIEYDQAN
jgi:mannan endo-1,4-beta-mannosidase